jgi:hypothetical protein
MLNPSGMPMNEDEMAAAMVIEAKALARNQLERGVVPDLAVAGGAMHVGCVAAAVAKDKAALDELLGTLGKITREAAYSLKFGVKMPH